MNPCLTSGCRSMPSCTSRRLASKNRRTEDPKIRRERGWIAATYLGSARFADPARPLSQHTGCRTPAHGSPRPACERDHDPQTQTPQNSTGACVWDSWPRSTARRAVLQPASVTLFLRIFASSDLRRSRQRVTMSAVVGQYEWKCRHAVSQPARVGHPALSRRSLCVLRGLCARLVFSDPPSTTRSQRVTKVPR
jgi:hypothetical protein